MLKSQILQQISPLARSFRSQKSFVVDDDFDNIAAAQTLNEQVLPAPRNNDQGINNPGAYRRGNKNDGFYYPDYSGRYIHDNRGQYIPDNRGLYVHIPGPDGPPALPYDHVTGANGPNGNLVQIFKKNLMHSHFFCPQTNLLWKLSKSPIT